MKKLWQKTVGVLVALMLGATTMIAFAAPAQAVNSWTKSVVRCDYVYVYRHYDFDWWEETFQGKRDYDQFLYSYYSYNWYCHNLRP